MGDFKVPAVHFQGCTVYIIYMVYYILTGDWNAINNLARDFLDMVRRELLMKLEIVKSLKPNLHGRPNEFTLISPGFLG